MLSTISWTNPLPSGCGAGGDEVLGMDEEALIFFAETRRLTSSLNKRML